MIDLESINSGKKVKQENTDMSDDTEDEPSVI